MSERASERSTQSARDFYDDLAPDYHLLFADWAASTDRQGAALDRLLRAALGDRGHAVLDCACGIGTQAIGLAARGHAVTGADLSPAAARRAGSEARARGLRLPVVAADMRRLPLRAAAVDAVVCADNSVAHLLRPAELLRALRAMRRVLRPGGLLLVGTRPDAPLRTRPTTSPPQVHATPDGPVITVQLWDWHRDGRHFDLRHVQLVPDGGTYRVRVRRATSWVIAHDELAALAAEAGFTAPAWHAPDETGFPQPLLPARAP